LRRDDDRYLFLEAILSARSQLYISYQGRSQVDNALRPPSVLVSDLLDFCVEQFVLEDSGCASDACKAAEVRQWLVSQQPLQPFHPQVFAADSATPGFAREWYAVAEQKLKRGVRQDRGEAPFCSEPLTDTATAGQTTLENGAPVSTALTLSLEEVLRFYRHPAKYFLNKRLGIYLDEPDTALQDDEPFEITGLNRYQILVDLLEAGLDKQADAFLEKLRCAGQLPAGQVGRQVEADLQQKILPLQEALAPLDRSRQAQRKLIWSTDDYCLQGTLTFTCGQHLIHYRPANLNGKDRLLSWIQHLFATACQAGEGPDAPPTASVLLGLNSGGKLVGYVLSAVEVDTARHALLRLLALFQQGLQAPLPLIPELSLLWAEKCVDVEKAEQELEQLWWRKLGQGYGTTYIDSVLERIYQWPDSFGAPFRHLAEEVFEPLLAHEQCHTGLKNLRPLLGLPASGS
jgi:exodeoxyribonuclease V gamma subunit